MKIKNWTAVQAMTGGSVSLPVGAYVAKILSVKDDEEHECLEIVWDVAEGDHAGHYNDEWGMKNTWAHTFKRYYGDSSEGNFKTFLDAVESSNPGKFSIAYFSSEQAQCNPNLFVGMLIGLNLRKRIYVAKKGQNAGKTQEVVEVGEVLPAADVRAGKAQKLEPRDTRTDEDRGKAVDQANSAQQAPSQSLFAPQSNLSAQEIAYAATVPTPF